MGSEMCIRDSPIANYTKVSVTGRYEPNKQWLIHRSKKGTPGYQQYSLFKASGWGSPILIDRGWIAREAALFSVPLTKQTIKGTAYIPGKPVRLSSRVDKNTRWPKIIPSLDLILIGEQLGVPLSPFIVVTHLFPVVSISPARHKAYAFQWFSFGIIVLLGYVGFLRYR